MEIFSWNKSSDYAEIANGNMHCKSFTKKAFSLIAAVLIENAQS